MLNQCNLRLSHVFNNQIPFLDRENTYLRATLATDGTPRRTLRPNSQVLSDANGAKTNFSSALDIFLHATLEINVIVHPILKWNDFAWAQSIYCHGIRGIPSDKSCSRGQYKCVISENWVMTLCSREVISLTLSAYNQRMSNSNVERNNGYGRKVGFRFQRATKSREKRP